MLKSTNFTLQVTKMRVLATREAVMGPRNLLERIGLWLGILFTLIWPMLLGAVLAGRDGIALGASLYLAFGLVVCALWLLGGIRGIL